MRPVFSYALAFDRNIGWLTEWEQLALRGKRIAIAGMGGVGGVHLLTLARFGIGAFSIADFDRFDIVNFNRQIGATMATVGRPKIDVLAEMALAINPELRLNRFEKGIDAGNVDAFLEGVDLFVDGFDFFELAIRRRVYARCAELGIPALCAAPIGMGAGCLAFVPGGMSFEEYFRFEGQSDNEQYLRFLIGLAPRGLHRAYLVDPGRVDLPNHKGPSTGASCTICAGITAVNAVKLLLRRGEVQAAPYHHHYDAFRNKLVVSRLPRGLNGPLQRLKLAIARRVYESARTRTPSRPEAPPRTPMDEILNLARWAPSPGNAQPWRVTVTGADSLVIDIARPAPEHPYAYRGAEPTCLAAGTLIETMRIAASAQGLGLHWRLLDESDGLRVAVEFARDERVGLDPLFSYLTTRSVDRRPYRRRALTEAQKSALASALGDGLVLSWHEPASVARLASRATRQMARRPDAVAALARAIDSDRAHSPSGIPAGALGLGHLGRALLRRALRRGLPGSSAPPSRMAGALAAFRADTVPIRASGGCFSVRRAAGAATGTVSVIEAGRAVQRLWLAASRLGLAMQPLFRPLAMAASSPAMASPFRAEIGDPEAVLFLARIGAPRSTAPNARSTRRPLMDLITTAPPLSPAIAVPTEPARWTVETV